MVYGLGFRVAKALPGFVKYTTHLNLSEEARYLLSGLLGYAL